MRRIANDFPVACLFSTILLDYETSSESQIRLQHLVQSSVALKYVTRYTFGIARVENFHIPNKLGSSSVDSNLICAIFFSVTACGNLSKSGSVPQSVLEVGQYSSFTGNVARQDKSLSGQQSPRRIQSESH